MHTCTSVANDRWIDTLLMRREIDRRLHAVDYIYTGMCVPVLIG
jgi:hypothetical protein